MCLALVVKGEIKDIKMLCASLIIPTFNRKNSLVKTLTSLSAQSLAADSYEVIVVDDGSTDNTAEIQHIIFPFSLQYIYQPNQGSAIARNTGAKAAKSQLLIFIDDDILVESDYIKGLVQIHELYPKVVGMGSFLPFIPENGTLFTRLNSQMFANNLIKQDGSFVHFTDCWTNNLSVELRDFFEIGMMEDVAGDGPTIWGDVDFGYRAFRLGFRFYRSAEAKCYHDDYSILNLKVASSKAEKTAQTAVFLFEKYPDLREYLPMFFDKYPINWKEDNPKLIVRKLARRVVSSQLALWFMRNMVDFLERHYQSLSLLGHLYSLIIGSCIYRGYRQGLREHNRA